MNRNRDLLEKRCMYIKNAILNSKKSPRKAVERLSRKLFLSTSTIWKDLKKSKQ